MGQPLERTCIFDSYQLLFLSVRTTVHIFCLTILFKSESPAKDFFFNVSVFITINGGFSIELRFCDNFYARLRFLAWKFYKP